MSKAVHKVRLGSIAVAAPKSWVDLTPDLDDPDAPYTLAKQDGVGALQFSIAVYRRGKNPSISAADLQDMLREFERAQQLRKGFDRRNQEDALSITAASYHETESDDFIRLWYVSDGKNVALVSYTCSWAAPRNELQDCEHIVESISFTKE